MGYYFYFLRKQGIYIPREGWNFFGFRLAFANSVLGIWLWISAGNLQTWLSNDIGWRATHLAGLLVSAGIIYFAALWIIGVRLRDVLMLQGQPT